MPTPTAISMPYTTDLSEREWALLATLFPLSKSGGHPRTVDLYTIFTGIFHVLRSCCQWRLLPRDYRAAVNRVYGYFRACAALGQHLGASAYDPT